MRRNATLGEPSLKCPSFRLSVFGADITEVAEVANRKRLSFEARMESFYSGIQRRKWSAKGLGQTYLKRQL